MTWVKSPEKVNSLAIESNRLMLNHFMSPLESNEVHQKIQVKKPILRRIWRHWHRLKFKINKFKQPPISSRNPNSYIIMVFSTDVLIYNGGYPDY
jgi:poly-beta-hydroxyalkanoate depolymerase